MIIKRKSRIVRASVAVEAAMVLPLLMLMLVGVVSYGTLFYLKNHMVSAAREGARKVAIQNGTPSQGEQAARNYLSGWALSFTITAQIVPSSVEPGGQEVSVEIKTPFAQAAPMLASLSGDWGGLLPSGDLKASATMRKE